MAFKSPTVQNLEEFMSQARARFKLALSVDQLDREEAKKDVRFEAGDQWAEEARRQRKDTNRPCITDNRLPVFVEQVVNDGRQNKPAIKCTPLDDGTPETAELFQGRIRHIEYESDADIAYDTSRRNTVVSGRGGFRVSTRYKPGTREQELFIDAMDDQFAVVWDPFAKKYDRSDAEYCFVDAGIISREEYKRRYGKDSRIAQSGFFEDGDNPAPGWVNEGPESGVRIAEYWKKVHTERDRCRLADGTYAWADELTDDQVAVETWKEDDCKLYQYIIDGVEIQDETEWLTSDVPVVPQWGCQRVVEGKRLNSSLLRFAKTDQEMVNLSWSSIAEHTAMLPKTPYEIPAGGIPVGSEGAWAEINTDPRGYILYNVYDSDGRPIPPPKREVAEPPIVALIQQLNHAIDGIKASMGIFDASLGARGNETSGIAIQRRQKEADNANFHFHDNEARSRRRLGRILIPLIKKIDAGEKVVSVRDEEGEVSQVRINTAAPYLDPKTGKQVHHQLDKGDYGTGVSTGPSFLSQKDEAADRDSQLLQAVPELIWVIGDQYFRNLNSPGAEERADRMARAINMRSPGLIEQKPQDGQQPIPPEVQQAIAKRDQLIDQLTKEVDQLSEEIRTNKFSIDSKERIEMRKLEVAEKQLEAEILLEQEKMGSAEAIVRLKEELANIRGDLEHFRQLEQTAAAAAAAPQPGAPAATPDSTPAAAPAAAAANPGDPGSQPQPEAA